MKPTSTFSHPIKKTKSHNLFEKLVFIFPHFDIDLTKKQV
jgi:hypothetical protein